MTKRVCLVTCAALPDLDPDDAALLEPLRRRGVEPSIAVWDDPAVDWTSSDLVVIRNPWDYTSRREQFVEWARRVPRLANPADIVAWNTDKRYLADLAAAGVAVVPTTWIDPTDAVVLPASGRHVVKPSVGAGSLDAAAYTMHEAHERALAAEHAMRLLAGGRTAMVQPYLDAIEKHGETGLIYIGGKFSHAIYKGPMLALDHGLGAGGLYRDEVIKARTPTPQQLALGAQALAAVPGGADRLLYARVDLVPALDGSPILMELELTEPSLFMHTSSGAVDRFAEAIAARV